MLELYVRCPITGEPVYAGFQLSDRTAPKSFLENSICPACAGKHDWQATPVCSAIPVTVPAPELPSYEAPSLSFETRREEPVYEPARESAWPKVA